jgi:hypothetical protein
VAKVNYDWVKDQFTKAKIKVGVGMAVLEFLKTWEKMVINDADAKKVFEILSRVALGHALVAEGEGVWTDAMPGNIKVGDVVRVKVDAFGPEMGPIHNGRLGVIVAVRSGDIIVNSTDDVEPKLAGTHYSPYHLQKLVK